jgi:hypothetical protein
MPMPALTTGSRVGLLAGVLAGVFYSLAIFALGFVLGTARELVLAPLFGREIVIWVEVPMLLLASWFAAGWLIRKCRVPASGAIRLVMGATAFALLMSSEAVVAVYGLGRSLVMHLSGYVTARGALELLPQIAFGLIPLFHMLRERRQ